MRKQIQTIPLLLLVGIMFVGINMYSEVIKLKDYPSHNPIVDTIRTGFFQELNLNQSFWGKQYPIYSDFYSMGDERDIEILEGHPDLTYKEWLQEKSSPLVVILPGLGGHFTSDTLTAMGELFYTHGCSVIVISSAMNWEFMSSAGRVDVPGYTPEDAADIYHALQLILKQVHNRNEDLKFTSKTLCGYSLGGLHTLFIAAIEQREHKIGFDSFLAINPPVDLLYALRKIDEFYSVWRENWSKSSLRENAKIAIATYQQIIKKRIPISKPLPLTVSQAKFLIGYSFRRMLTESIFSICKRKKDMGLINASYSWFSREDIYQEINEYSFERYVNTFLIKYYARQDLQFTLDDLNKHASLTAIGRTLANDPKIRVIHSMDDFLLTDENRKWLKNTLKDKIVFFNHGGHLGNLYCHQVQKQIILLSGIKCENNAGKRKPKSN